MIDDIFEIIVTSVSVYIEHTIEMLKRQRDGKPRERVAKPTDITPFFLGLLQLLAG